MVGRGRAQRSADSNCDAYSNRDAGVYAHSNTYGHTDGDANCNTCINAGQYPDADAHSNTHGHADAGQFAGGDPDSNATACVCDKDPIQCANLQRN